MSSPMQVVVDGSAEQQQKQQKQQKSAPARMTSKTKPRVKPDLDLPMGWTQMGRTRRPPPAAAATVNPVAAASNDGGNDDGTKGKRVGEAVEGVVRSNSAWCCPDPTCFRNLSQVADTAAKNSAGAAANAGGVAPVTTLQGTTILLLPSIDCTWFQGHFVPSSSVLGTSRKSANNFGAVRPIGLLGVERTDTDECMLCRDGGYREMDLTVFGPSSGGGSGSRRSTSATNGGATGPRKKRRFERAICTGGDMVRLRAGRMADLDPTRPTSPSVEGVAFDAERILTGNKAAPYLVRYFSSVVDRLVAEETENEGREGISPAGVDGLGRFGNNDDAESRALEALPDCAVVLGQMIMTVPVKLLRSEEQQQQQHMDVGDDDGFMSD